MAFGDSDNDLEMLAGVGMSVAMGMVVAVSRKLPSTSPPAISKTESTRPWNILVFWPQKKSLSAVIITSIRSRPSTI